MVSMPLPAAIVTTLFAMWLIRRAKSIRISAYLALFKQYLNLRAGFCGLYLLTCKQGLECKRGPRCGPLGLERM
jgi:hypothetical protein